ncbi:hypothetical protein [Phenylobacterium sp. J367]|uniref:hypothetical protein n=1 Tax=Phenylobacterium sp. J367 TaxID=2898435 RepID=UPI0021508D58|nr:hypothetical protein [Phenylobacterium sp. J367]MCR5879424.1 hypothetical protein [Phenylobacterium sp. J367]
MSALTLRGAALLLAVPAVLLWWPLVFDLANFELRFLDVFAGAAFFAGLWLMWRSRPRRPDPATEPALT